jgi:hypothetical protein
MAYAADLDGSGEEKNQLKTILSAVTVAGLNVQDTVNMAVANGEVVLLNTLQTPDLMTASCAGFSVDLAKPLAMGSPLPKYDGTDMFTADGSPANLFGSVTGGNLATTPSKSQTSANEQKVEIQLPLAMGMSLPLTIHGVQVTGTLGTDPKTMAPVITNGVINGAVSQTDITGIISTVAMLITQMINSDPTSSTTMTIIGLFENPANPVTQQKCMTMSQCCADSPKTCVILPAEVQDSPVGGLLAPDVQVFDANGNWAPVPKGTMKNGMSVGLGFTSIKASF